MATADQRSQADRYLASYQKLCLFPFLASLLSVISTFMLYANGNMGLTLSFFLIHQLMAVGLQVHFLWIIGLGIMLAFLVVSAYAAKGKWWLLLFPLAFLIADLVLGIVIASSLVPTTLWLGIALRSLFIVVILIALFMAYKTTQALRKEKSR